MFLLNQTSKNKAPKHTFIISLELKKKNLIAYIIPNYTTTNSLIPTSKILDYHTKFDSLFHFHSFLLYDGIEKPHRAHTYNARALLFDTESTQIAILFYDNSYSSILYTIY